MFKQTKFSKRSSNYLHVITSHKTANCLNKKQKKKEKRKNQQHYLRSLFTSELSELNVCRAETYLVQISFLNFISVWKTKNEKTSQSTYRSLVDASILASCFLKQETNRYIHYRKNLLSF